MIDVWVLIGNYRRKPSEILGVYEHYERGKQMLDAAAICGDFHEVALTKYPIQIAKPIRRRKGKESAHE